MDKYIQEDYQGFIFQVYISHMDFGHLVARSYILEYILIVKYVL